ncbi:MAG: RAD55 family ATPase [Thermoproteus sp. AZ2]|uniref:RAD55 family ATPase n=1 Tax=Thermoproteus sp. AZ2 TaxID=1609232 RepID=A0ACC6V2C4_9CREN
MFSLRGFTLLYGPPGAGKTALALRLAAEMGQRVLYIGLYEPKEKVEEKLRYLGLDPSAFAIYDFINVSDYSAVMSAISDAYMSSSPDAVIVDGINYFPQTREAASALYRIFDKPVIAIGEEQTIQTPFAYMADNLIAVEQYFKAGARYRVLRFVKTRLSQPPAVELYFAVVRGGPVVIEHWTSEKVSTKIAAELPMKRAVFAPQAEEAVRALAPFYKRLGIFEGARVADFICEDPECLRLAAAFMCDYAESAETAMVSTYRILEYMAREAGCSINSSVVSADDLADDKGLEALRDAVGKAKVLYFFGLEEVLAKMGPERVRLVLDFLNAVRPDLAILAVFRGVEPARELVHHFNTVWKLEPKRAVVVKSMFGWPVRDFRVEKKDGVYYLVPE